MVGREIDRAGTVHYCSGHVEMGAETCSWNAEKALVRTRLLASVWAVALLSGLACVPAMGQTNEPLKAACDRYWEASLRRSPTRATSIGDYRFNDKLDDLSADAEKDWAQTLKSLLGDLRKIDSSGLSEEDRLTRDLLERAVRDDQLRVDSLQRLLPLEPLDGPQLRFPLILVSQPFRNAEDFRAYIARLRSFPKQVGDIIDDLHEGMKLGIVSPRVIIEKVVPQLREQITDGPKKSVFYEPADKIEIIAESEREPIKIDMAKAIEADVMPAYRRLLEFVEKEYLPKTRDTVGIGVVPGGREIYEKLAALNATVRVNPADVHQLGLAEVERIRGEMAKIQKEVAFEGSLDAFLEQMRSDKKFRFSSRDELLEAAGAHLMRAKSQLPKLFGRLPKADCVMKEIEAFRAAASPVAYYNPPPEDGSRPGYYYINTYKPEERLKFTLEALSYHEAVPGHHLQIALDQENTTIPKFRRYGSYTAYVEGWALYTEKLGYEINGYKGPYNRFGQFTFEMWRACRLVVDTGMHAQGWTREQAIEFMAKNASLARVDIENEVDRYISWPGQALGYKIGELRILGLRAEAEKTLGAKFDVRAFHDALLAGGAMPIDMLEGRMKGWIAKQK